MGGVSAQGPVQTASSAASGPAGGTSGTGYKVFNIGGNPNSAGSGTISILSNPFVIGGAVLLGALYLWKRK